MIGQNWFATNEGQWRAGEPSHLIEDLTQPYRLYRFLTDLEDILDHIPDDSLRLQAMCPLVRKLLTSSTWLHMMPLQPDPEIGWEVTVLYNEPFFPLTVQLVAWSPGILSPIHNHASWGLVALLSGQEKNIFWQRSLDSPDKIAPVGEQLLTPGDILCFMPETIHQIEALGDQPTISFNLYGETDYDRRFEFDPIQGTATHF